MILQHYLQGQKVHGIAALSMDFQYKYESFGRIKGVCISGKKWIPHVFWIDKAKCQK